MLLSMFAIYDTAVQTWRSPVFARSRGQILREFADAANNPQTEFAKHPADYVLFELGTFDDDKCEFNLLAAPVRICIAMDFVKTQTQSSNGTIELKSNEGAGV